MSECVCVYVRWMEFAKCNWDKSYARVTILHEIWVISGKNNSSNFWHQSSTQHHPATTFQSPQLICFMWKKYDGILCALFSNLICHMHLYHPFSALNASRDHNYHLTVIASNDVWDKCGNCKRCGASEYSKKRYLCGLEFNFSSKTINNQ